MQNNYSDEDKLELLVQGEIFQQLLESERFTTFFNSNFDLEKHVDEENKTVTFKIVEVAPEVALSRLTENERKARSDSPLVEPVSPSAWKSIEKRLDGKKG